MAAEEMVASRGWTRSRLYTEAIRQYLRRQDPDEITARLDQVYAQTPEPEAKARRKANRAVLKATEW